MLRLFCILAYVALLSGAAYSAIVAAGRQEWYYAGLGVALSGFWSWRLSDLLRERK